ncbi:MAG: hypothetical protein Q8S02_16860 [Hydrogenophaga sp.]|nr:hypothetical protein [Hydrogenophaga sp.]
MFLENSHASIGGKTISSFNPAAVPELANTGHAEFRPTLRMVTLRDSIVALQNRIAEITPMVLAVQMKVLSAGRWVSSEPLSRDDRSRVVLVPEHTHMLSDEDRRAYQMGCIASYKALRLPVNERGDCPLLVMKRRLHELENDFFSAMSGVAKLSAVGAHGLPPKFRSEYLQRCMDMIEKALRAPHASPLSFAVSN